MHFQELLEASVDPDTPPLTLLQLLELSDIMLSEAAHYQIALDFYVAALTQPSQNPHSILKALICCKHLVQKSIHFRSLIRFEFPKISIFLRHFALKQSQNFCSLIESHLSKLESLLDTDDDYFEDLKTILSDRIIGFGVNPNLPLNPKSSPTLKPTILDSATTEFSDLVTDLKSNGPVTVIKSALSDVVDLLNDSIDFIHCLCKPKPIDLSIYDPCSVIQHNKPDLLL
jgi:hypothetical protein